MPTITFRINLQTIRETNNKPPYNFSRESAGMFLSRSAWFPNHLLNDIKLEHGEEFTRNGNEALYLLNLFTSGDFKFLDIVSNDGGSTFTQYSSSSSHSSSSSSSSSSTSFLDSLTAYWKLDETSGDRTDSINNFTMIENGSVNATTGKLGNAAGTFSGTNYLSNANGIISTVPFTMAAWSNLTSLGAFATAAVLTVDDGSNWAGLHWLEFFGIYSLGYRNQNNSYRFSANLATWVHVVAVQKTSTFDVWINGHKEGSAISGAWTLTPNRSQIGVRQGTNPLNGYVDEAAIWNRELSSSEISFLYNSGNGRTYPFS